MLRGDLELVRRSKFNILEIPNADNLPVLGELDQYRTLLKSYADVYLNHLGY